MGLTLGLAMVVYLLGLIMVEGLRAFWPGRVAQIELRQDSQAGINNSRWLAGEIVKVQQRATRNVALGGEAQDQTEWQVMVGNKETYGFGFKYLDYVEMARVTYPPEILVIDRLEYGNAIGFPMALQIKGEGTLPVEAADFPARLRALVDEVNQRWAAIRRIERHDIGAINAKMESLGLQQRALMRAQKPVATTPATQLNTMQDTMARLQGTYEVLAQQVSDLRNRQAEHMLIYRLMTGEERRLPLGWIVHYYFPNQLQVWQRLRLLLHNLWVFFSEEPREAN